MYRASLLIALASATAAACGSSEATIDAAMDGPPGVPRPEGQLDGLCEGQTGRPRVLVYSRENLWRHVSNLTARQLIYDQCVTRGWNVTTTNDANALNVTRLGQFDVVVYAVTSGADMDPLAKADVEAFVRGGGGLVGIHSASATEWEWPFYVDAIGAKFMLHAPGMQRATVRVELPAHPIVSGLPTSFVLVDEWYVFQTRPEDDAAMTMLLALDEDTLPADYPAEYKVGYHPIGWAHEKYGGRVFYTAIGHNSDAYANATFAEILVRSIEWAARAL